jgi:hypothetical protein
VLDFFESFGAEFPEVSLTNIVLILAVTITSKVIVPTLSVVVGIGLDFADPHQPSTSSST